MQTELQQIIVYSYPGEGNLSRVISLVERKGFVIRSARFCNRVTDPVSHQQIKLVVVGATPIKILCCQLERLICVDRVEALGSPDVQSPGQPNVVPINDSDR